MLTVTAEHAEHGCKDGGGGEWESALNSWAMRAVLPPVGKELLTIMIVASWR